MIKSTGLVVAIGSLAVLILISGCATKRYGRLTVLSDAEKRSLTCREIDIEISKCNAFLAQVSDEAQLDGRSVLGFLGDFGIGNAMERGEAEKSARKRLEELQQLRREKGCP